MSQGAAPAKAVQQRLAAGTFLKPTECAGWVGTKGGTSRGRQLQSQCGARSAFLLAAALMPSTPATLLSERRAAEHDGHNRNLPEVAVAAIEPTRESGGGRAMEARGRHDRNLPDAGFS